MRAIRKRPRPDTQSNEPRRAGNRLGRLVYLGLLAVLGIALGDYFWGDMVLFRADGLVVREKTVVAASYMAQVRTVAVQQGDTVAAGAHVMQIESTDMLERLADLSIRAAELAEREAELKAAAETAKKLLPFAERRERTAGDILTGVTRAQTANLVVADRYFDALNASFDAQQTRLRLQSQAMGLGPDGARLSAAVTDASRALADLRAHYAKGEVSAPVAGTVGAKPPAPGTVLQPGETMLTLYSGPQYVLAYLPTRYLFAVRPGLRVEVVSGRVRDTGTLAAILPLTNTLPQEFQAGFRPLDRNQIARVKLDHPDRFPLFAKVYLKPAGWLPF